MRAVGASRIAKSKVVSGLLIFVTSFCYSILPVMYWFFLQVTNYVSSNIERGPANIYCDKHPEIKISETTKNVKNPNYSIFLRIDSTNKVGSMFRVGLGLWFFLVFFSRGGFFRGSFFSRRNSRRY